MIGEYSKRFIEAMSDTNYILSLTLSLSLSLSLSRAFLLSFFINVYVSKTTY